MDMQGALRARLLATGPLATLVARRIEWLSRPQAGALPAVTLTVISDERPDTFGGFAALRATRVQVDCWAADYAKAKAVADAVVDAVATPAVHEGIKFSRPTIEGPRDGIDQTEPAPIVRATLDLIVWHQTA